VRVQVLRALAPGTPPAIAVAMLRRVHDSLAVGATAAELAAAWPPA
jgi:hypothetical protein